MLAYLLAFVVGLGSLAIYLAAFFFPEIHRKNDFIWSGVGMFYALVLWIFAPRITGGLLLGHIASVALLVWFGGQTLSLRRQLTPEVQQTPIPSSESVKVSIQEQASRLSVLERLKQLPAALGGVFSGVKGKVQQTLTKKPVATTEKPVEEVLDQTTAVTEQPPENSPQTVEEMEIPSTEVPEEVTPDIQFPVTEQPPENSPQTVEETEIPTTEVKEELTPPSPPQDQVVSDNTPNIPADIPSEKLPPNSESGS
ncbi:Ycf66 family protein [Okeanomitos corallinicola TIOX110]|uniref:Ycf66 family protein n=1 Tax=Okeanomitos corallinicola TIOX110 TaxID=3133117 RepID=A0ABZ2UVB5_9CYAN